VLAAAAQPKQAHLVVLVGLEEAEMVAMEAVLEGTAPQILVLVAVLVAQI